MSFENTGLFDINGKEIRNKDILKLKVNKFKGDGFDLNPELITVYSMIEWWHSDYYLGYRLRNTKGHTMKVKPSSLKTMQAEIVGSTNGFKNLKEAIKYLTEDE